MHPNSKLARANNTAQSYNAPRSPVIIEPQRPSICGFPYKIHILGRPDADYFGRSGWRSPHSKKNCKACLSSVKSMIVQIGNMDSVIVHCS